MGGNCGIRDIVGFHGSSVDELEAAFHEAVEDYLAHGAKLGLPANKPFSGRMLLPVPPELHAQASIAAKVAGLSLNQWATKVLASAVGLYWADAQGPHTAFSRSPLLRPAILFK